MPGTPRFISVTNARNRYHVGDIVRGPGSEVYYVTEVRDDSITIEQSWPGVQPPLIFTNNEAESLAHVASAMAEVPERAEDPFAPAGNPSGLLQFIDSNAPRDTVIDPDPPRRRNMWAEWDGVLEERQRRPKRVMITGSREWTDEEKIRKALSGLPEGSTVVHGNARGADKIADRIAKELGFEVDVFPAKWREEGRRAGFLRNQRMVTSGIDKVIAFWDGESRGTAHAIYVAKELGIRTKVVYPQGVCDER